MMRKQPALVFAIFMMFTHALKGNADSLLQVLDRELAGAEAYLETKQQKLDALKRKLAGSSDRNDRLKLLDTISREYASFHYDSAFQYVRAFSELAHRNRDPFYINEAKMSFGFIFISSGMFKEAVDTLYSVNRSLLDHDMKQRYFSEMAIMYYAMADLQDIYFNGLYESMGNAYVDTLLDYSAPGSYSQLYYRGLKFIRSGRYDQGLGDLTTLYSREDLTLHQRAILTSTMSDVYINRGEQEQALAMLAEASICDIQSATRETAAILNLANILLERGDVSRAYTYTKRALEDANYYGARHRKIQVGSILPIIEEEKINTVERQKRLLLIYAVAATVMFLIIVLFIIVIQRQLLKIKAADREITARNEQLHEINQKLREANRIKDEYIGYYFNALSTYIEKLENFKGSLEKNLGNNKFDTVRYIVNNLNLRKERMDLYQGFDRIFLSLFPDFVTDFNALFLEKDRFRLGDNELLNTDLRIFALIRLGITENDKIARILDFSVNTIYTYKTKIKNRSIVPNEEFEQRIMEIKVI